MSLKCRALPAYPAHAVRLDSAVKRKSSLIDHGYTRPCFWSAGLVVKYERKEVDEKNFNDSVLETTNFGGYFTIFKNGSILITTSSTHCFPQLLKKENSSVSRSPLVLTPQEW